MQKHVLIWLFCLAVSMVFGSENLVRNGDFSLRDKTGRLQHWSKMVKGLKVVPNPKGKGNAVFIEKGSNASISQYDIKVRPGKNYKVSYLLKTDFPKWLSAASFQILWMDKKGRPLFTDYKGQKVWNMTIKNVQGTRDWTRMEMAECTAPKDAHYAKINLSIAFDKDGACWFADIQFTEQKQGDAFANRMASLPYVKQDIPQGKLLDEAYWKHTTVLNDFLKAGTYTSVTNPTLARVFYTDSAIYVHVTCSLPKAKELKLDKRDLTNTQEACEVFFQPPGIKHHYQIIVDPDGKLTCYTETWNDGSWPMKCYPWKDNGILSQTVRKENCWQYALKIPFAGLQQRTPAEGTAWLMNVCRGNYAAKPRELSAWGALKEPHFQFPGYFGKVFFRKNIPLVKALHADVNGATLRIVNPLQKNVTLKAAFLKQNDKDSSMIDETEFTIAAGQERNFSWQSPTKSADMRFLEVRCQGQLLAKHCNMPTEEFYSMGIFDPEGVRGKVLNIAVDHPFFIGLTMLHNAKGRTRYRIIDREEKPYDLTFETPEGLCLTGLIFDAGEWRQSKLLKPQKTTFLQNGRKMIRSTFALPFILNWNDPGFKLLYHCDMPVGKEFTGSYYFTVDGRELAKNEMSFRTLKIGSVKRPLKKFGHDMFYLDAKILSFIFPKDTLKHYTSLGMNRITVNTKDQQNQGYFSGTNPKKLEDYYDLLFKDMEKSGIRLFFTSNSSSATPTAWYWTDKDTDARAIGADGKDAPYNQYGYPALCPTYRGKFFQKHANMLKNSYLFNKYKCNWLTLDLELWPKPVWNKLCFCPRCLADFKAYAAKNGPQWASCDVRKTFSEGKDKAFMTFWNSYKDYAHQRFILDLTAPVKNAASKDYSHSFRKKFLIGEWCRPRAHLMDIIDYFELGLYYTPDVVYGHFRDMYKQWGDAKKNWYPTFTFGQTGGCPDFHMKAEQLPELIYEAAIFGGQGICWFHHSYIEPLRMSKVVQGINTILPVEDLIVDGHIIPDVSISNPAMQLTARRNGTEGLLAIRAYKASAPQTGTVIFANLKAPLDIFDCISRQKVATVTPAKPQFNYTVQAGRCRLLYVGKESAWTKRNN